MDLETFLRTHCAGPLAGVCVLDDKQLAEFLAEGNGILGFYCGWSAQSTQALHVFLNVFQEEPILSRIHLCTTDQVETLQWADGTIFVSHGKGEVALLLEAKVARFIVPNFLDRKWPVSYRLECRSFLQFAAAQLENS